MSEKPGTNYYEGSLTSRWTMLDQMVVSPSLVSLEKKEGLRYRKGSFEVIQNPKKRPVLVYARDTMVAINKTESDKIMVEVTKQ